MVQNKYIGSDFDNFLREEGTLEEVEAAAAKRTFVIQLERQLILTAQASPLTESGFLDTLPSF